MQSHLSLKCVLLDLAYMQAKTMNNKHREKLMTYLA